MEFLISSLWLLLLIASCLGTGVVGAALGVMLGDIGDSWGELPIAIVAFWLLVLTDSFLLHHVNL